MSESCDLVVVGGGPAGYVSAIRAAQLGAKVILVEKETLGGTCLNRGCIPTKSYLRTAEILLESRNWKERGILADGPLRVDMKAALACKDRAVRKLTGGVKSLLAARGVRVLKGTAVLKEPGEVIVDMRDSLKAGSIILAGGSVSSRLPIPGAESKRVLLSEEILALDRIPASLAVIGGGVIGVEFAQIFAAFGTRVTVLEAASRLLPAMDHGLSEGMRQSLEKRGIQVLTGVAISSLVEHGEGIQVRLANGEAVEAELALLSVGRKPDLSCLGTAGVATEKGRVLVDADQRTNLPGVYAPGDINGTRMLAHAAFAMGESVAETIAGTAKTADMRFVPSVVYGSPELASVGLTEQEARSIHSAVAVGTFPFSANGRAIASGDTEGFIKVVAEESTGEILGIHMLGAHVSELTGEAAVLMKLEATLHEAAEVTHAHPTLSEALLEAVTATLGRCIHLP
jgi:dihydrolipoamide dehydrogenase